MSTLYWAVYDGADPTTPAEVKSGSWAGSGNVFTGTDSSPTVTTPAFQGTPITGLTPDTTYKLAAVWSDGPQDSNVDISAPFNTLPVVVGAVMKLGTVDIDTAYVGNQKLDRAYLGSTIVLGSAP